MNLSPSISVVVNNYNYASYLVQAVDSALHQLTEGDEIIVVDDGSTDESRQLLEDYQGRERCRVLLKENGGQIDAVRAGIELAGGDIVMLLDSDDLYLPGHLERTRGIFLQYPDVSMSFASPSTFGPDQKRVRQTEELLESISYETGILPPTPWATLLFYEFIGTPTSGIAMRNSFAQRMMTVAQSNQRISLPGRFIRAVLGLRANKTGYFNLSIDGLLVRSASALGATRFFDRTPGFRYRIHGNNFYATLPRRGQLYVRTRRKQKVVNSFRDSFGLSLNPSADQLSREIRQRSWPIRPRRRTTIRLRYALHALRARGSLWEKIITMLLALGVDTRSSSATGDHQA